MFSISAPALNRDVKNVRKIIPSNFISGGFLLLIIQMHPVNSHTEHFKTPVWHPSTTWKVFADDICSLCSPGHARVDQNVILQSQRCQTLACQLSLLTTWKWWHNKSLEMARLSESVRGKCGYNSRDCYFTASHACWCNSTEAWCKHQYILVTPGQLSDDLMGNKGPNGVRILSLSLFPLRLYWECLMRRMFRVAFGLPLSCSELGSSVAVSFFFPLDSADGSLLKGVKTRLSWD